MLKHRDFHSLRQYSSFQLLQQCTQVATWPEPCGTGNAKAIPEQCTAATVTTPFPFTPEDTCQFQYLHFTKTEQCKGPPDPCPELATTS